MRKQKGMMILDLVLVWTAACAIFLFTAFYVYSDTIIKKVEYQDPQETLDLAVRFDSFGISSVTSEGNQKVIITTSGDKFAVNWGDDIENMTSFEIRTMPAGNQVLCAYQKCAEVLQRNNFKVK